MVRNEGELLQSLRDAEARQALLLALLSGQRHGSDPEKIMRAASAAIGEKLGLDRVGFFEWRDEDSALYSAGWTADRVPLLADKWPANAFGADSLAKLRTGDTLAISDTRDGSLAADSGLNETGVAALIVAPVIRSGVWQAGFYVHNHEQRIWTDDEIALVRAVGELTWDAVERARSAIAVQANEGRLNMALDAGGGVGIWDWDIQSDRIYSDARLAYLFSIDPKRAAAGAPLAEYMNGIYPEDRARVSESLQLAISTDQDYALEYRVTPPDGSVRWLAARGRCLYGASDQPIRLPGIVIDITDRKKAEIDLRKQWNTFDTALSNTPDFTYIFDVEGRFTYANRALCSLLQRTLEEMVGRNFHELDYPPELAHRLQQQIQWVLQSKQTLRDETPFTGPSGKGGIYEYIFVPVLDEAGRVEAVAGSTRDITDRNRAGEMVEEDRRHWRDLLAEAPAGIAVLRGPNHRFEWANHEYVRLLDRPAESFIGKSVIEALPEVEGQIYEGLLNEVYQTGRPFVGHESPLRLQRSDGVFSEIYVNFVYMPTRNALGAIDGVFVHVTEVTGMVEARKQIQESERQFRQLANSMPLFVWTALPDGSVDYYNDRWYHFTGSDRSPVGERSWESLVHPEERLRVRDAWQESLHSGAPFRTELRFWDKKENRWRWFMSRAVAVNHERGQIAKWFGTSVDIDEQKISQQALLHTQKLESIGLLAGGIAHDFNNLLVGIMGSASFALEVIPESSPAYSMLQNVVESSERAAHLTRQMLAYAGKGRFIIEPVNLSEMAAQTVQLVNASIPKSVIVKLDLDERLPTVDTDPGQMQQVVMNLVINAAEAVGEKSGVVVIRTRAEELPPGNVRRGVDSLPVAPGLYVVLEVEDTGSGIDPSTLTKIFDPFFTTKFTGRGLGLAAVAGVVRSHQGGLEVESKLGAGSLFRVLLPANKSHVAELPVAVLPSPNHSSETVLMIDDEAVVRRVAEAALERSGFRAVLIADGAEGLTYIRDHAEVALVLLDMSMPGLSGRDILEAIQNVRPQLPVIICSGYSEEEVYRQFAGLEIAGVLPKPFTTKRLTASVRSVLDGVNRPQSSSIT